MREVPGTKADGREKLFERSHPAGLAETNALLKPVVSFAGEAGERQACGRPGEQPPPAPPEVPNSSAMLVEGHPPNHTLRHSPGTMSAENSPGRTESCSALLELQERSPLTETVLGVRRNVARNDATDRGLSNVSAFLAGDSIKSTSHSGGMRAAWRVLRFDEYRSSAIQEVWDAAVLHRRNPEGGKECAGPTTMRHLAWRVELLRVATVAGRKMKE